MIFTIAIVLTAAVLVFTLFIRQSDLPPVAPESPTRHLDERKAAIYENLRDLNFEYRLGKLSDSDYQSAKLGLQKELAGVMAEIERIQKGQAVPAQAVSSAVTAAPVNGPSVSSGVLACPHCNARFEKPMKFCGECGKPLAEVNA